MSKLPVKRVVTSSVNLTPNGAQSQSLSDCLILGNSDVIDTVERMRTYASLADVATDFGTAAAEYLAAVRWFGQAPQPTQIRIGRWAQAATKGGLRCAPLTTAQQTLATWTAINNAQFKVAQDAGAVENIGPIDFTGAANLNAIAALITTALGAAIPAETVTCKWNATYQRFEFESSTVGAASAVSFLTAGAAGTDISGMLGGLATSSGAYTFQGSALETIAAALAVFDNRFGQLWYGVNIPTGLDADQESAAQFIEASGNKHMLFVTTEAAATLLANDDTCLAALLRDANLLRTTCQYSGTDPNAGMSYAGRLLTVDYSQPNSTLTMKFKTEPGVTAENLATDQADAVEAKNCNVFVAYDNNTAIIEQGVQSNGTFSDVVTGTDALALMIQTAVYNALYTTPTKIPQTDNGVGVIVTAIEGICSEFVQNGFLAPGVWESQGFGQLTQGMYLQKGYYVWAQDVASQNPTDRLARKAPPIKVAAKLAGAIHHADISIVVNQ